MSRRPPPIIPPGALIQILILIRILLDDGLAAFKNVIPDWVLHAFNWRRHVMKFNLYCSPLIVTHTAAAHYLPAEEKLINLYFYNYIIF